MDDSSTVAAACTIMWQCDLCRAVFATRAEAEDHERGCQAPGADNAAGEAADEPADNDVSDRDPADAPWPGEEAGRATDDATAKKGV